MRYLTDGAQEHIANMDRASSEVQHEHKCANCEDWVEVGRGVKISEEVFCLKCIAAYKHFDFYRNECGLVDSEIYEHTKNMTTV